MIDVVFCFVLSPKHVEKHGKGKLGLACLMLGKKFKDLFSQVVV